MAGLKNHIATDKIPSHIAVIMDGNGRWARKQGIMRVFGHRNAINAVRETIEGAAEIGVKFLTLFAFSTENWQRPQEEVHALMDLLVSTLKKEVPTMMKNNIRLTAIGTISDLPQNCQRNLAEAIRETAGNDHMTVALALSYGARRDILEATKKIAAEVKKGMLDVDDISEDVFRAHLTTSKMPDPELMIRTSGEFRISNFLLWELAYTEIFISDKLWPDFTREDLFAAIINYQNRERRFGKTSEQLI